MSATLSVTNVTSDSATLSVSGASSGASVVFYWGTSDGGTYPPAWANKSSVTADANGFASVNLSGLASSTNYYSNAQAGGAWVVAQVPFTTLAPTTPSDVSGTFVGVGTLSAPTIIEESTTSGGFVGVGSLSATLTEAEETGGGFTGVGNLSASVTLQSPYIAGTFVGVGSLIASADLIEPAAGGFVGVGSLSATPDEGESTSGAFVGIGTLSATVGVVESPTAAFVGVGSVSVQTVERKQPQNLNLYIFNSAEVLQAVLRPADGAPLTSSGPLMYYSATHSEQLYNATNAAQSQVLDQFVFTVPANHPDSQYITEGAFVAYHSIDGTTKLFEVTLIEYDGAATLYQVATCEQVGPSELATEWLDSFAETTSAVSASTALSGVLNGTRWGAGTVTVTTTQTFTLVRMSVAAALSQLVQLYGGELSFRVTISGNAITGRYVDWIPQRGSVTGKRFEYGKDLESVTRTVDITKLFTAVYGYGSTNYTTNVPLDFSSVTWSTGNGDPVDKPSGQLWVEDPNALALYGYAGGTRNRFTAYTDSNQTIAADLLQEAWDYLQTINAPAVTYQMTTVDLEQVAGYAHEAVRLGDTVNVIDTEMSPPLRQSMRVVQLDRDLLDPLNTQVTLGVILPAPVQTASQALTALENASAARAQAAQATTAATSATTTATSALSSATTAISTATSAAATASTALQPGSTIDTSWLNGIISADQNALQSAGGYVTVDSNGITILNASTYANATQALRLAGGIFGISDQKDGAGGWTFTTFGTGAGFDASQVNTGTLDAAIVNVTNMNASNITTGDLNLGGPNQMNFTMWDLNGQGNGYELFAMNQNGVYFTNSPGLTTTFTYAATAQTTTAGHSLNQGDMEMTGVLWLGAGGNGYLRGDTSLHLISTSVGPHFMIQQASGNSDAALIPTSNNTNVVGESGVALRAMYSYSYVNASSGAWKEAVRAHNIAESIKVIHDLALQDYVIRGETRQRVGLIAEDSPVEVQSEDGHGIDLYAVIAHLVGAVQDLQAKVYKLGGGN
ncbi:phage tail protein [Alicyclobacillus sp. ALC3]|uniref:phage tail protein n=1 Tax=Alicyclobacillus sp. ALC3 TaxID=2796143 RepID=UPI002379655C|nr:phage tail protein [Alicyclobacillus sp. ALC3]WDL96413.1 phage tail protein [Alicyclobacillus sp. ALC3]